jgi:hypothetical protein
VIIIRIQWERSISAKNINHAQQEKPNPENPETFTGLKLNKINDVAAGIPVFIITTKYYDSRESQFIKS